MLKLIKIKQSTNGRHEVELPYRHEEAMKGFYSAEKYGLKVTGLRLRWAQEKTVDAMTEFIDYWFYENPLAGRSQYKAVITK
jgi:hypothetical protein